MAKVALADVLWTAANKHLAHDMGVANSRGGVFQESCCAVLEVICPRWFPDDDFEDRFVPTPAARYLQSLGCSHNTDYFYDTYPDKEQRQGVRYMWLLLAMHVAEDEGVMVEVSP